MFSIQVSISGSQCLASKNSQFYLYDGFISKGLSIVVFLSTRSATIYRFFCVQKMDFSKTPSNKLSDHWNNSSQKKPQQQQQQQPPQPQQQPQQQRYSNNK